MNNIEADVIYTGAQKKPKNIPQSSTRAPESRTFLNDEAAGWEKAVSWKPLPIDH